MVSARKPILEFDIYPPIRLVRARLAKVLTEIPNWKGAWWRIAQAFYAMEKRAFATEGVSQGAGWAALSPNYQAWKAVHAPGKGKLELTGKLKKSMTQRSAEGAFYESTFREFAVGTVLPAKDATYGLGQLHQTGTSRMPARPPLVLDEKFMVATREIMITHAWKSLRKLNIGFGSVLR